MVYIFFEFINTVVLIVIHCIFALIKYVVPMALWPKKSLEGELAVVTGAGSGIGREISLHLAKLGCKLVLWDVDDAGNEETAKMVQELGQEVTTYHCDVTDRVIVCKLAEEIHEKLGNVSLLFNNAGIISGKKLMDLTEKMILNTINVNTLAHFWTIKAFLPSMIKENKGHIITMSSILSEAGIASCSDYCASKAAVKAMHQTLTREMIIRGADIKFTCVCPYHVSSGLFTGIQLKFQTLLPSLTPEYVGRKVVEAVQTEQDFLYLPYQIQLAGLLANILPLKAQLVMEDFLGANIAMDSFTGRVTKKTENAVS